MCGTTGCGPRSPPATPRPSRSRGASSSAAPGGTCASPRRSAPTATITDLTVTLRDITARKGAERELFMAATHDPLTGLANRAEVLSEIERALSTAARSGRSTAVLMLDLDHFKKVNDSLGHATGDRLLVAAAQRLSVARARRRHGRPPRRRRVRRRHARPRRPDRGRPGRRAGGQRLPRAARRRRAGADHDRQRGAHRGRARRSGAPTPGPATLLRRGRHRPLPGEGRGPRRAGVLQRRPPGRGRRARCWSRRRCAAPSSGRSSSSGTSPRSTSTTGEVEAVEALLRWRHPSGEVLAAERFIADRRGLRAHRRHRRLGDPPGLRRGRPLGARSARRPADGAHQPLVGPALRGRPGRRARGRAIAASGVDPSVPLPRGHRGRPAPRPPHRPGEAGGHPGDGRRHRGRRLRGRRLVDPLPASSARSTCSRSTRASAGDLGDLTRGIVAGRAGPGPTRSASPSPPRGSRPPAQADALRAPRLRERAGLAVVAGRCEPGAHRRRSLGRHRERLSAAGCRPWPTSRPTPSSSTRPTVRWTPTGRSRRASPAAGSWWCRRPSASPATSTVWPRRSARPGFVAVAPALFHRSEEQIFGYGDFDKLGPVIMKLTGDTVTMDVDAALAELDRLGQPASRQGIIGFCMGGSVTLATAARLELGAAVTFYGGGLAEGRFGLPSGLESAAAPAHAVARPLRRPRPAHPDRRGRAGPRGRGLGPGRRPRSCATPTPTTASTATSAPRSTPSRPPTPGPAPSPSSAPTWAESRRPAGSPRRRRQVLSRLTAGYGPARHVPRHADAAGTRPVRALRGPPAAPGRSALADRQHGRRPRRVAGLARQGRRACRATADRSLFVRLRGLADAVLVGAGTVRAEGYGPVKLPEARRAERVAAGRPAVPPLVVVSRSLDLDWDGPAVGRHGRPRPDRGDRVVAPPPTALARARSTPR